MMFFISVLLLFAISEAICGASTEDKYKECLMMERHDDDSPRFNRHRIVQVALHEPAYLHCIIPQFSHNLVAWTRVSDEALLTAGDTSFTSDPRFQVSVKSSQSDWVLIIRRAVKSDSGCYLCEVNTEPKSTVYAVYLNVIERKTNLMANMIGDEVLLNCTITVANETAPISDEVQWSRDGRPIDFTNNHKYISKVKRDSRTIVHTVRILGASSDDDGNYACSALDAPESSHMLHVNSDSQLRSSIVLRILCLLVSLSSVVRLL